MSAQTLDRVAVDDGTIDIEGECPPEFGAVWGTPLKAALGLLLNERHSCRGPNPKAFGTAAGGGSFAMADRERSLSAGYRRNRWWPDMALGDRARALIDATDASL
jgi:hypothetical protein